MNVTLHGNTDSANVTKLRILRWGGYSVLSRWALAAVSRRLDIENEGNMTTEARCCAAGFENGGESHGPQDAKMECKTRYVSLLELLEGVWLR